MREPEALPGPPFLAPWLHRPLPFVPLAKRSTAVERLSGLSAELGAELWIKRDDQSSPRYGGNKVRKLELLLGRALARGRRRVVTAGALGTHHGLATAAFGEQLGLETELLLWPQPLTDHVRSNLRAGLAFGARVQLLRHPVLLPIALASILARGRREHAPFELIPPGGSDGLGTLGYVDAGLELAEQVERGLLPAPDYIWLPAGTCGTAAGLALGLCLGGLEDVQVMAVQVVEGIITNRFTLGAVARGGVRMLRRHGPRMNRTKPSNLRLVGGQLGAGYGHPCDEAQRWLGAIADCDQIQLEPTYTAKALAGMVASLGAGLGRRRHLFWNTVSSVDLSERSYALNLDRLPAPLRALLRD